MQIPYARQFGQYDTMVQTMFVLTGLLFVIAFVYFVVLLSAKLLGIILLLGGLWFALYFPGELDYQRTSFGGTGKLVGFIVLAIGLALAIFG
jgi:hypothetical protein